MGCYHISTNISTIIVKNFPYHISADIATIIFGFSSWGAHVDFSAFGVDNRSGCDMMVVLTGKPTTTRRIIRRGNMGETMHITTTLTHDVRPVGVDAKLAKRIATASTKRPTGCNADGFGPFPTFDDSRTNVSKSGHDIDGLCGVTIQHGQNVLFEHNRSMMLTDPQMAALWRWLWPNRVMRDGGGFRPSHVPGARAHYVAGKHGNTVIPEPGIKRYMVSGSDDRSVLIIPKSQRQPMIE